MSLFECIDVSGLLVSSMTLLICRWEATDGFQPLWYSTLVDNLPTRLIGFFLPFSVSLREHRERS